MFKIISQLVKKLLKGNHEVPDEASLINSLQEEGYKLDDINQAFEFIFSSSDIIDVDQVSSKNESITSSEINKRRILDIREKFKFNLHVQGIIIKLDTLEVITSEELEIVLASSIAHRKPELDAMDFWEIIEDVVDDQYKLAVIAEEIPEFKVINTQTDEYAH